MIVSGPRIKKQSGFDDVVTTRKTQEYSLGLIYTRSVDSKRKAAPLYIDLLKVRKCMMMTIIQKAYCSKNENKR